MSYAIKAETEQQGHSVDEVRSKRAKDARRKQEGEAREMMLGVSKVLTPIRPEICPQMGSKTSQEASWGLLGSLGDLLERPTVWHTYLHFFGASARMVVFTSPDPSLRLRP